MLAFWKVFLSIVLLCAAGWFWGYAQLEAPGSAEGLHPDVRLAGSADAPASAHTRRLGERRISKAAHTRLRVALGQTADASAFRFDRVIIDPIMSEWVPENVVVGDVTGDRRPDVVMSMSYTGSTVSPQVTVRIYAQTPNGSLAAPIVVDLVHAPGGGHGLELADMDGNGVPEIVVGEGAGLTVISRSGGRFVLTARYAGSAQGIFLAPIDADGDGFMDVFAQGWEYGADIFLGDGRGGIRGVQHLDTSYAAYATVEASDFNADGLADVLMQTGHLVRVYPSRFGFGLRPPIELNLDTMQPSGAPWGMTVADVDSDGRPDLVVSDQGDNAIPLPKGVRILYRGSGNSFSRSILLDTTGPYANPGAVRVADLDGNGYPDMVTMFDSNDQMGYFLQGPSGFAPVVIQNTDDNPWSNNFYGDNSFAVADVNSDQCPDIVLAETSSSLRIFYGRSCRITLPRMGGPLQPLRR